MIWQIYLFLKKLTNIFFHYKVDLERAAVANNNLLALETDVRLSFLQRRHLVTSFLTFKKAYDRTWRCEILKDFHDLGLKGNVPIFIQKFLHLRKF